MAVVPVWIIFIKLIRRITFIITPGAVITTAKSNITVFFISVVNVFSLTIVSYSNSTCVPVTGTIGKRFQDVSVVSRSTRRRHRHTWYRRQRRRCS